MASPSDGNVCRYGATVERLYNNLVVGCGDPRFGRIDAPCTKEAKVKLEQLNASSITATEVDGDAITNVRTLLCIKICLSMVFVWKRNRMVL